MENVTYWYALEEQYISTYQDQVKWRVVGDREQCRDEEHGIKLAQEIETKSLPLGNYSLAVYEVYRDHVGEYQRDTIWFKKFNREVKTVWE